MEDRTIDMEVDGIRFISHGHYYDGINNWLCHKLKESDPQAIDYCARQLAKMLPENAVIVPIPGHHGYALNKCRTGVPSSWLIAQRENPISSG